MGVVVTKLTDREHRRFSPSQSERFLNCPGSVNLLARLPVRDSTTEADEGTKAHHVLETALKAGEESAFKAAAHSGLEDKYTKTYTEFHDSVQTALDYVYEKLEELDLLYGDAVLIVEQFVDTPSLVASGETGGFVDIAIYSARGRILYVIDYKHGAGVAKAAAGNTQVSQYAAGLLYEEDAKINPDDIDTVVLTIVQPRAFHPDGEIREYKTTPLALKDYLVRMDDGILACMAPNAPLVPGLSWCQFCDAKSSCPALANSAVAVMLKDNQKLREASEKSFIDIKSLDVYQIAKALAMKPLINSWLRGVEAHADELSRKGVVIPGFKRVEVHARREYFGDHKELATKLAALVGCKVEEVMKEPELLSITDMEEKIVSAFKMRVGRSKKKLAAEEARKMFAFYTLKKSSGNTTLVPLDDTRPSVDKVQTLLGHVGGLIPPTSNED